MLFLSFSTLFSSFTQIIHNLLTNRSISKTCFHLFLPPSLLILKKQCVDVMLEHKTYHCEGLTKMVLI